MNTTIYALSRTEMPTERWDDFVHASPDGYFLALSCWLDLVEPIWPIVDKSFALLRGGETLAQIALHHIPCEERLAAGGWGWTGPMFAQGLSSAVLRKTGEALMRHIISIASECRARSLDTAYSPVTRRCLEERWGVNPLVHLGFTDTSTHSRVVDLAKSEDELWADLSENTRRGIRRARSHGYAAAFENWRDMVGSYYEAHQQTYARTGAACIDRRYFEGMARVTAPRGISRLTVTRGPEGEPAAFVNLGCHQNTVWYHTGCSFTSHLKFGAVPLAFWQAMLDCKSRGIRWFDMGEVLLPTPSDKHGTLSLFKSKFGGETHRYFRGNIRFDVKEQKT